tara:strand:- start:314 stop:1150 length:837 start_codon:yes stop_codon:yes gene_type:complete
MDYNYLCPVCNKSKGLRRFKWGQYHLIHCAICELDYCGEMIKKEIGGNSSPVNLEGIEMMADVFHRTNKLAKLFSIKRKKYYENLLKRKCNKILEVGCGPGVFYNAWKDLNVDWTGVDINPFWKEFGGENGVPVSNDSIDSIQKQFDVIVAHQVIEHVENPLTFMNDIKSLLKPGGIIHLELPNQLGFSAKLRKISPKLSSDYGFIQPPMHLRAYTKKTIKYLFETFALEAQRIFVCGNTDRIWGQVREYKSIQKLYYSFTGKIGMGSLLIGVAQLKS